MSANLKIHYFWFPSDDREILCWIWDSDRYLLVERCYCWATFTLIDFDPSDCWPVREPPPKYFYSPYSIRELQLESMDHWRSMIQRPESYLIESIL